jgi:hypothetical protein
MIEFKQTNAFRLWLGILFMVLLALYLQTRRYEDRNSNFLIHANAQAIGAKVVIDGKQVGILDQSDLPGSAYRGKLSRGEHLVEIDKPGLTPFKQKIDMGLEGFVGVDLRPEGKQEASNGQDN